MANESNIKPHEFTTDQSREQAAKNGRKGGLASAAAKKERKTIADCLRAVLDEKIPNTDMTKREAMVAKVAERLYKDGDIKDLKTLTDILGESVLKVETNQPTLIVTEAMAEAIRKRKEEEEKGA